MFSINQGTNEDDSQSDSHPSVCQSRPSLDSDTDEAPYMETGGAEEIRNRPHLMTGIHEETPYCSLGTSSGQQKKARSASQPPFNSEITPATFEADQILLAHQRLASNSNSFNIHNNMNKISKLLKSSMTTLPPSTWNQRNLNCLKSCSKRV